MNVDVVVVTFEKQVVAESYSSESGLSWPILVDESRSLYAEYGMKRGGWWAIFGPSSWWGYLELLFRGRRLRQPTGDVHQLGGDVLIDPSGIVQLHHIGQTPVDRPSVPSILEVIQQAA